MQPVFLFGTTSQVFAFRFQKYKLDEFDDQSSSVASEPQSCTKSQEAELEELEETF